MFLLFICGALELETYGENYLAGLATAVILILTAMCIWIADKFRSDYYASLLVEAIPALWLALYLVIGI